jgi:hypothetical protein
MVRYKTFLLIILLFGCKAKETTVERTRTSDTLITKSFDYVSQPIETNYSFSIECDSLGNVKEIKTFESSGANSTSVNLQNNQLDLRLLTGLSRVKTDTIYKTKYKDVLKTSDVVRYKTPIWMWITIILQTLVIILLFRFK